MNNNKWFAALCITLCIALWLINIDPINGSELLITSVTTTVQESEYKLHVQIEYGFSAVVLEALDNGVPVTIQLHIQIRPATAWFWQPTVADMMLWSSIRYQPLTELYTVTHAPPGLKKSFITRSSAITALGEIEDLPLVATQLLQSDRYYLLYLKVAIDLEALPLPLRPIAYLSPSWNLSSGWTQWPLNSH